MRFLHCSDVHITQDYAAAPLRRLGWRRWIAMLEITVGGRGQAYVNAPATLKKIAQDVERHGADHLIVSGDLTAYATEEEFQGAKAALSPLVEDKRRCTVIPGNHDTYTPGSRRTFRFEKYFGHLLDSDLPDYAREGPFPFVRLLGEEVAVVGLSSARVPYFPGLSYGVIGKKQLQGLEDLLQDPKLRHRAVLIVVHHAPLTRQGEKDKRFHGLVDGDALFRLAHGPRVAVLHGHIHQRYHHEANGVRPHIFGAGSSTQAGREGYWIIDVRDGVISGSMHAPS